jgi:GrpB-like predicted nucleotidyltransferase (UPF0157 family)
MPPPFKVELLPHDRRWAKQAESESRVLAVAVGLGLLITHHVGSTAIPGIHAKSILDLMPVVTSLAALDSRRQQVEAPGYEWWGEFGLPGRRYCTKSDRETGRRLVQLHCYAEGSPEITRHLAFRDYLRRKPEVARAYGLEKMRCQALNPDNSHAYADCKDGWIKKIEAEALSLFASE